MGVQLGLTKSLRCQLPEGTDGTGYWKVTVYALGYQDYTFEVQATSENIVSDNKGDEKVDTTELQKVVDEAKKLVKADYTASSWASFETELAEAAENTAYTGNSKRSDRSSAECDQRSGKSTERNRDKDTGNKNRYQQ